MSIFSGDNTNNEKLYTTPSVSHSNKSGHSNKSRISKNTNSKNYNSSVTEELKEKLNKDKYKSSDYNVYINDGINLSETTQSGSVKN